MNRITAGRLYFIAQALGVEVGYFFEGLGRDNAIKVTPQQRLLLGAQCHQHPRTQAPGCRLLARALAEPDDWH